MFKLNRLTDYGVVVLTQMARNPDDLRTAPQIAQDTGVPLPTVAKLLNARAPERLITPHRGAAGGYTCGLNGVPFVVIRVLSDTASEGASGDFAANLAKVCRNSFAILERLIPEADPEAGAGEADRPGGQADTSKPDYQRAS